MIATKTKKNALVEKLDKMGACGDSVEWVRSLETTSPTKAWDDCSRGDWMLWWAGKHSGGTDSPERKSLVLCACEVARTALKYVKAGENRPLIAIETAERWAKSDTTVSLDDVQKAAAYAAYAADAAAYAAYAAYAADAAAAAAAYAAYAARREARSKSLAMAADIVRKHYPTPPGFKAKSRKAVAK